MAVQTGGDRNSFLPPDPDAEPSDTNPADAEALSIALKAYNAANG